MNKKGFTLIELLSVIVILAVIALIAVPIILNIIEDTKEESIKVSVQSYIDSVENGISKNLLSNILSDYDGTYTIEQQGKKLSNGSKIINPEYKGKGLTSGSLVIENGKVVNLIDCTIENWYAKLEQDKIILIENLDSLAETKKYGKLVDGNTFNITIKNMINNITNATYETEDQNVTYIGFYPNGKLPNNYTKEQLNSLTINEVVSLEDGEEIIAYYDGNGNVYIYSEYDIKLNEDSSYLINYFEKLITIDIGGVDTSGVENMRALFAWNSNLTTINGMSTFDTSNVINLNAVFGDDFNLVSIQGVEKWDTSKVINMYSIFHNCFRIEDFQYIENWNTSSLKYLGGAFLSVGSAVDVSLYLSNWDVSKVTNMDYIFAGTVLNTLDISGWDINSVTKMEAPFSSSKISKKIGSLY